MLNSPIVESKKITLISRINQYILEHKWCRYVVITNKHILVVRCKKYCEIADRDTLCDLSCARCDKLWARVFIVRLKYYAVQKILCRVHKLLHVSCRSIEMIIKSCAKNMLNVIEYSCCLKWTFASLLCYVVLHSAHWIVLLTGTPPFKNKIWWRFHIKTAV